MVPRLLLGCYWLASLDFSCLGKQVGFSTKPLKSYSLFAGGSTATESRFDRFKAPVRRSARFGRGNVLRKKHGRKPKKTGELLEVVQWVLSRRCRFWLGLGPTKKGSSPKAPWN